jgi:hypothetical protein
MIKLSYREMNNYEFVNALRSLAEHRGFDTKTAYNIGKIKAAFDRGVEKGRETYAAILKKFADLNEDGSLKLANPNDPRSFNIAEEKKGDFKKASEEFMGSDYEIPRFKISVSKLEGAGLSPSDLIALEPILTDLEMLEGGAEAAAAS